MAGSNKEPPVVSLRIHLVHNSYSPSYIEVVIQIFMMYKLAVIFITVYKIFRLQPQISYRAGEGGLFPPEDALSSEGGLQ
jgi:hypothetical protein